MAQYYGIIRARGVRSELDSLEKGLRRLFSQVFDCYPTAIILVTCSSLPFFQYLRGRKLSVSSAPLWLSTIIMSFNRLHIRQLAWMLIAAFMLVVVGQYHHTQSCCADTSASTCQSTKSYVHTSEKTEEHHDHLLSEPHSETPVIKKVCQLCDFHFFQSPSPQLFRYVPFLALSETALIERVLAIVYRTILQINAHSPPPLFI